MNLPVYLFSFMVLYILSIVIHEAGHLIFGLLTGYRFCSFTLFKWIWYKKDGKLVCEKVGHNLFLGQCLMLPPEDRFPFVLYNLGGGLLNLVTAAPFIVLTVIYVDTAYLFEVFYGATLACITMALVNLVPLKLGVPNDGLNVVTALRSDDAAHALHLMLTVNYDMMNGKRYADFDDEMFRVPEGADVNNYLVAYTIMQEGARLEDLGRCEELVQIYDRINLKKLPSYYRNTLKIEYLYYYSVYMPNPEKAREYYDAKLMKRSLKQSVPSVKRIAAGYEFFVNGDREKARTLLETAKAQTAVYPNIGYRLMESDLIARLESKFESCTEGAET